MRNSGDSYYKELDNQKRWFWLRILSNVTVYWGMFVLVFMVIVLSLIILFPPAIWIYDTMRD